MTDDATPRPASGVKAKAHMVSRHTLHFFWRGRAENIWAQLMAGDFMADFAGGGFDGQYATYWGTSARSPLLDCLW